MAEQNGGRFLLRVWEQVRCGVLRCMGAIRRFWRGLSRHQLEKFALTTVGLLLVSGVCFGCILLGISAAVCGRTHDRVLTAEELAALGEDYDCVLVLGCRVYEDGRLSDMLKDRVLTGSELIAQGISTRLLMSGDHRTDAYNEVDAMKAFAVKQGIPSEQIFLDHDGYSTYDSIYRLKHIYGVKKTVIVTQEYHLYRALYLAEKLGITAVGVPADRQSYTRQTFREIREVLARCKDVYYGLTQPLPEVLGDAVELSGNGDLSAEERP